MDSMRKGTNQKRTWEERYRKEKVVGLREATSNRVGLTRLGSVGQRYHY